MSLLAELDKWVRESAADVKSLFSRALPPGGTAGQVLTKSGAGDYQTAWAAAVASRIFRRASSTSTDNLTEWQDENGAPLLAVDAAGRIVGTVPGMGTVTLRPIASFFDELGWEVPLLRMTRGRFDFDLAQGAAEIRVHNGSASSQLRFFNLNRSRAFCSFTDTNATLPGTLTFGDGTLQTSAFRPGTDIGLEFRSSFGGGIASGMYYENMFGGGGYSTTTGVAGQLKLTPFFVTQPLSINQLVLEVTAAASAGTDTAYIGVYGEGANHWPGDRLFFSGALSGFTATGAKAVSGTFTFQPGVKYWLAVHTGSNPTLRAIAAAGSQTLGAGGAAGTNVFFSLVSSLAITTPMPASYTFASSQLSVTIPAAIRMRASASS